MSNTRIGGPRAAQALWLLEYLGFDRVCLLEGGIERWMAEGRPTTRAKPQVTPTAFAPSLHPDRLATAEWIVSRLEADNLCLLDCRTQEEYDQGHIPGARNLPWEWAMSRRAYHAFRPAGELQADLTAAGISGDKEVVTYCSTGERSAHIYLTLRLLGYPSVRNYDGSWTEWEMRSDLPKA